MTAVSQLDIFEATRRRDEGMTRVLDAEDRAWTQDAASTVQRFIDAGDDFTADDVRSVVGNPSKPNAFGALFRLAVRDVRLQVVGHVQSQRPEARGRWLPVYRHVSR